MPARVCQVGERAQELVKLVREPRLETIIVSVVDQDVNYPRVQTLISGKDGTSSGGGVGG